MKRSNRLVLLIGIFLAIVAFVLIVLMLGNGGGGGGEPRRSQAPTTANVVVATKDIDLGTAIQQDQVGLKEIDLTAKPADSYTDTVLVVGQIARQAVTAGQLITQRDHQRHGLRSSNSTCPPARWRCRSRWTRSAVSARSIKPGDFVDAVVAFNIVPTLHEPGHRAAQGHRRRGRPVGQGAPPGHAGPGHAAARAGRRPQATPHPAAPRRRQRLDHPQRPGADRDPRGDLQQAEVLNYSQIKGLTPPNGITLVLRSSKDFVDAPGEPITRRTRSRPASSSASSSSQYGVLPPLRQVSTPPSPSPIARQPVGAVANRSRRPADPP